MCIRDRLMEVLELAESFVNGLRAKPRTNVKSLQLCVNAKPSEVGLLAPDVITPVSYTHLTLPTIYSV
mgnify:CR=1 FL=1